MKTNLYIPKTLKIGFQERKDTFTGKLAYVIYYDERNKLRKETSWNSWRDQKIDTIEIPNVPTDGFTMNKGFTRYSDWGSGRAVIRMWDQRDFEFEIGLDNLVGILMHSDVSKREIGEKCVFAWAGTELVLLPVNTEEYQASAKYTQKQGNKVSAKDLVPGYTYIPKKQTIPHIYLGRFTHHKDRGSRYDAQSPMQQVEGEKKHWFLPTKHSYEGATGILQAEPKEPSSFLSHVDSEEVHPDYAAHLEALHKTPLVQRIVGYNEDVWVPKNKSKYGSYLSYTEFFVKVSDGLYIMASVDNGHEYHRTPNYHTTHHINISTKNLLQINPNGSMSIDYADRTYYTYSAAVKRYSNFGSTLQTANVKKIADAITQKIEYPDWWNTDSRDTPVADIERLDDYIRDSIMASIPNAVSLHWVLENGNVTKGLEYGY